MLYAAETRPVYRIGSARGRKAFTAALPPFRMTGFEIAKTFPTQAKPGHPVAVEALKVCFFLQFLPSSRCAIVCFPGTNP